MLAQLCSFEQVKNNVAAKLTKLKTFNKFSPFVCPPTAFFECLVVELHPFYDLVYNNSVGVGFINVLGACFALTCGLASSSFSRPITGLQDQSVPLKSFPAPTPGAAGAGSSGFGGSGEFKRSPSGVISSDLNQSQSQSQSSQEGGFGSPSSQPSSQAPGMRSGWGKTATAAAAAKPAQPAASKPVVCAVSLAGCVLTRFCCAFRRWMSMSRRRRCARSTRSPPCCASFATTVRLVPFGVLQCFTPFVSCRAGPQSWLLRLLRDRGPVRVQSVAGRQGLNRETK